MQRHRLIPLFAALVLASGAAAANDPADPPKDKPQHAMHGTAGHSEGSKELHRIMMQGHGRDMPMSGDVDKDFAAMMTLHHQQGIEMADAQLKHGKNAKLKEVARRIREAQQKEIQELAPFK